MTVQEETRVGEVRNTKLRTWGTSQGVRIPKNVCAWAGVAPDDDLRMETGTDDKGRYILLRAVNGDGHRHYGAVARSEPLDELFAGYAGSYEPHEMDWGEDVGQEVLA